MNHKKKSHPKKCVCFQMVYVKKICPVCGSEFFVLKNAEEKAVYCTLACLTEGQENLEQRVPCMGTA
jgi:hypothetical protein